MACRSVLVYTTATRILYGVPCVIAWLTVVVPYRSIYAYYAGGIRQRRNQKYAPEGGPSRPYEPVTSFTKPVTQFFPVFFINVE